MIIPQEEICQYLFNPDRREEWRKYDGHNASIKMARWKAEKRLRGLSSIEHIFIQNQIENRRMINLALEIGIRLITLNKLFERYNLPYKSVGDIKTVDPIADRNRFIETREHSQSTS